MIRALVDFWRAFMFGARRSWRNVYHDGMSITESTAEVERAWRREQMTTLGRIIDSTRR